MPQLTSRRSLCAPTPGPPRSPRGAKRHGRADARQNGGMASHSDPTPHPNSFGAQSVLSVNGRDYEIFDLNAEALTSAYDVRRLPYAIKVLLENLLRHEDSPHVA